MGTPQMYSLGISMHSENALSSEPCEQVGGRYEAQITRSRAARMD